MTKKELYDSVAQLGFETSLEDENRFILATNRAIIQVNRIKPAVSIYKLNHFPLKNLIEGETFHPQRKDDNQLVFEAENVKSYYFECNGNGVALIERFSEGKWKTIGSVAMVSVDGRFVEHKGFILDGEDFVEGNVRLRFLGEYLYYVQNVAMYGSLKSDREEDIPAYAEYSAYDIARLTSDFLSFVFPPILGANRDERFIFNSDYFVEGVGKLLIPASTNGVFDVSYYRNVQSIKAEDSDDTKIDLDEELCAVLPNLIASYVWADDEPEKAQYYLSLYREQVAEIWQNKKDFRPCTYRSKNGW